MSRSTASYNAVTDTIPPGVQGHDHSMSNLIDVHCTWLAGCGRAKRTVRDRRRLLNHAEANLPYGLNRAKPEHISYYLADPRWAQWTRYTYHTHLSRYFIWAYVGDYLPLNPMRTLLRPPEGDRLPNPCTTDEMMHAAQHLPAMPWRMAWMLACYAGLRCCEIVTVRRQDCTAESLRVVGKGGKKRTVEMAPTLWGYIEPQPKGLLCIGARGKPLTAQMLTQMQGPVWERLDMPEMHMHRGRHWFATNLLEGGADLPTVQELMGHASIVSTRGYTLVVGTRRRAAVRLLPVMHGLAVTQPVQPAAVAA